jgi:hypothetical protein
MNIVISQTIRDVLKSRQLFCDPVLVLADSDAIMEACLVRWISKRTTVGIDDLFRRACTGHRSFLQKFTFIRIQI